MDLLKKNDSSLMRYGCFELFRVKKLANELGGYRTLWAKDEILTINYSFVKNPLFQ